MTASDHTYGSVLVLDTRAASISISHASLPETVDEPGVTGLSGVTGIVGVSVPVPPVGLHATRTAAARHSTSTNKNANLTFLIKLPSYAHNAYVNALA